MQVVLQNDDYKIYDVFDDNGNRYYLCVPNADIMEYKICCSLNEDTISLGEMLLKASSIYSAILKKKNNAVYAHMIIDAGELKEAAHDNDGPLYKILLRKVVVTTNNVYQNIIKEKVAGISKNIGMISQNTDDAKFFDWIEINQSLPIERINIGDKVSQIVDYLEQDLSLSASAGDKNTINVQDINLNSDKTLLMSKKTSNNYGYGNIVMVVITIAVILALSIGAAYILINQ